MQCNAMNFDKDSYDSACVLHTIFVLIFSLNFFTVVPEDVLSSVFEINGNLLHNWKFYKAAKKIFYFMFFLC